MLAIHLDKELSRKSVSNAESNGYKEGRLVRLELDLTKFSISHESFLFSFFSRGLNQDLFSSFPVEVLVIYLLNIEKIKKKKIDDS